MKKLKKRKIDPYASRYISAIKAARTNAALSIIVNKIYEDGFEDGVNEG